MPRDYTGRGRSREVFVKSNKLDSGPRVLHVDV